MQMVFYIYKVIKYSVLIILTGGASWDYKAQKETTA